FTSGRERDSSPTKGRRLSGAEHDPFHWSPEADRAFKILKRKLMEAPALGLPDLSKPFQLYVHERKGVALGMLTQLLGAWKRPVAYFSKQLDQVSKGWPACLRAVAATALVLGEAEKLTMGGSVQVCMFLIWFEPCWTLRGVFGSHRLGLLGTRRSC
uniref:Reverse transcriptase/retrotransposon-derived protein RNase H-like domain-containing protein n=1 Tax=Terrapene triunguis TaxID=2587831 RepID=A0A674J3Y2_9SAUR